MINDPRGYFKRAWQEITGFENETDARAKMVIYLLENGLVTTQGTKTVAKS
jgi:hypothetical protein